VRSFVFSAALMAVALLNASAFAEGENQNPRNQGLSLICESARLTDIERRECRAMFKAASNETALVAAFQTFDERINGPSR